MSKNWRDQLRDKPGARAADEEKRILKSEEYEYQDPGAGGVSGGPQRIRLGERSTSTVRPSFQPRGKPGAGFSMRVGGGVPFEIDRGEPLQAKPAAPPAPEPAVVAPAPAPPRDKAVDKVLSWIGLKRA